MQLTNDQYVYLLAYHSFIRNGVKRQRIEGSVSLEIVSTLRDFMPEQHTDQVEALWMFLNLDLVYYAAAMTDQPR